MQRTIVTPAILPSSALGELKLWLAITSTREDLALTQLLRTALDMFEAFTRAVPLEATYEEVHSVSSGWKPLGLAPVRSITGVQGISASGARFVIPAGNYQTDIACDQIGRLSLINASGAVQIAVTYTAGVAATWEALPAALRHGLIRLAAFHFRARESDAAGAMPPAAISALWQPFRRMRLA